ncbi:MAG: hypothetical protein ACRES5_00665, partial [Pseudomonas sp.]
MLAGNLRKNGAVIRRIGRLIGNWDKRWVAPGEAILNNRSTENYLQIVMTPITAGLPRILSIEDDLV